MKSWGNDLGEIGLVEAASSSFKIPSDTFAVWGTVCFIRKMQILFGPSYARPICRLH